MINKQTITDKTKVSGTGYQAIINLSQLNQRIVIKDYQGSNLSELVTRLIKLADQEGFTKVWAKVYKEDREKFEAAGFETEAIIDSFYHTDDACSMAYYLTKERQTRRNKEEADRILTETKKLAEERKDLATGYNFKVADKENIKALAKLYDQVFNSYPYPIDDEGYLLKMMEEGVIYGVIYQGQQLVAAASAETVAQYKNAEMTDFATLPDYRGQGLAGYLLQQLEEELKERDYRSLYTIARANIYGINKIFSQSGYDYKGTLIKNCNIAGGLEDMNLWCKVIG
ncbi:putative beta-lysine N-acetyltransferase [Halanaerocella petrolearia]